jgi:hypothetical protein
LLLDPDAVVLPAAQIRTRNSAVTAKHVSYGGLTHRARRRERCCGAVCSTTTPSAGCSRTRLTAAAAQRPSAQGGLSRRGVGGRPLQVSIVWWQCGRAV